MKPRTVLVLAVLVVTLAAFIWFVERDLPSSDARAELAGKLLPVEPDEVTGLTAAWQGRSVRFERRGDEEGAGAAGWWLVEPMSARADSGEVDRLVGALVGLEKKRTLEHADLQAVGLDAPRGTITLRAGDREWALGVGADVPTSDDVLVSLAEGGGPAGTYVTTDGFVAELGRDPGTWRDRDVFPAVQGAVERLTLHTPGEAAPLVLERRGDRFWVEQPMTDLADADRVDDLLAGLTGLRAAEFVDDLSPDGAARADGSDLGLVAPRLTIEAALAEDGPDQEPFRLELGAPVGQVVSEDGGEGAAVLYARAGGQTFTATTDLVTLGVVPVDRWRSPAWTGLRSFEIEGVEVEARDGSFSLGREGIDWQRDGETLPYGVVNDLLSAITEARGEVVAEGARAAVRSPATLTLRVTRKDGDPITLTLQGEEAADGEGEAVRLARSSERAVSVRLPGDTVEEILDALAAVREAEPEAPEVSEAGAPEDGVEGGPDEGATG